MRRGFPVVRLPFGFLHFLDQTFKLALADGGQILAVGLGLAFLIQVDRNLELFRDHLPDVLAQGDAVFHGDVLDRDERNHVNSAHAGMLAFVMPKVDFFEGAFVQFLDGDGKRLAIADEGDDRAVMIGIR